MLSFGHLQNWDDRERPKRYSSVEMRLRLHPQVQVRSFDLFPRKFQGGQRPMYEEIVTGRKFAQQDSLSDECGFRRWRVHLFRGHLRPSSSRRSPSNSVVPFSILPPAASEQRTYCRHRISTVYPQPACAAEYIVSSLNGTTHERIQEFRCEHPLAKEIEDSIRDRILGRNRMLFARYWEGRYWNRRMYPIANQLYLWPLIGGSNCIIT